MRTVVISILASGALVAMPVGAQDVPPEEREPSDETPEAAPDPLAALEARVAELEARLAAQAAPAHEEGRASDQPANGGEPEEEEEETAPYTLGAWVEAYYGWNFNEPSNGITDFRGFDNRHDSFNLSNVAVDAQWDVEGVNGRITLQWGSTPATYYLAETSGPTLGTGVGAQSISLWQFIQQAYGGYRVPIGAGLNVLAGLFLSPCGAEGMNVKDDWFYSRSNLFYGYPFYHTGLRISYPVVPEVTVVAWLINGWNTVLDNNDEKSVMVQATLSTDLVSGSVMYMTGVERPAGAPEGRAWRHLFDLNATVTPLQWLTLQGQLTGMVEPNNFGTSASVAAALAARVVPIEWLAVSARGDFFWEQVASNGAGTATAIFWPTEWVSSFTASVEIHPEDHVSFRIEYRHDQAAGPTYFQGTVMGDGNTTPFVHNANAQDTITFGTTAWF